MAARVLVTGAGGFVGRHAVAALRAALPAAEVIATGPQEGAAWLDVTDPASVNAALREHRPDVVLHLAGIAAIGVARDDPARAWAVNLHGTLALAAAILDTVPACTLLHVSSADTYGGSFRAGVPLDETAALAPLNTYAATKAAADLALGAMVSDGLRVVRLRPFNHTGPGQAEDFVVAAFARQVARIRAGKQTPVLHVGALAPRRDFLDVRDVCAAYAALAARAGALDADALKAGLVLNIASGTARRVGDILDALLALSGVTATVETAHDRMRPGDIAAASGDATRARATLGWAPAIAWEQTLRDVLDDWYARVATEAG